MRTFLAVAVSLGVAVPAGVQPAPDPHALLQEADRLAWLRAWSQAEAQFTQAQQLFTSRGDTRNALYAEVSALRARLPRLSVPDVSAKLTEYLEQPLVQQDDRLRLRCLVIKGETDEDLDPMLAGEAWRAALTLAEKLGEQGWANRARGELGLVAFLEGNMGGAIAGLGSALKVAQTNGDIASQVRWLTLFGHGYVEMKRPQEALDFYDRALKAAATVPELQFPTMTYVGRANALIALEKIEDADALLTLAGERAAKYEARGYKAQLVAQRAAIAEQQKDLPRALTHYADALALARASGGTRLVAEIALAYAKALRDSQQVPQAEALLAEATGLARDMEERWLLPKLLAATADVHASRGEHAEADALLQEATELLEGLLTTTSSPWAQSRVISGMDDVLTARIRLEARRSPNPARAFAVLEQARARSLIELLVNRPVAPTPSADQRTTERRISSLQRQLLRTRDARTRRALLTDIFAAEETLAPTAALLLKRPEHAGPRPTVSLVDLQRVLRSDEVLLQYALADPSSLLLLITRTTARVVTLPGRTAIVDDVQALLKAIDADGSVAQTSRRLGQTLLAPAHELAGARRVLVSPDGDLHRVPFDLLTRGTRQLLDTHIVSYVPSASVLAVLRQQPTPEPSSVRALAVSMTGDAGAPLPTGVKRPSLPRNVYGLDGAKLPPLPGAYDEARAVVNAFGDARSTLLAGETATETALKRTTLADYQVLHFAAHGLPSTKFPARAALLIQPDTVEDGLLQAREVLGLRLNAAVVTLSACESGTGSVHGQDGAATLIRPFIAAGARSVVANLWDAEDAFSLALMRRFYEQLAAGRDVATALRAAKRQMRQQYGPGATPKLWSSLVVYGDGRASAPAASARTGRP